ncbi:MAG: FtsW/RodA/SpoVE family cell cycle protein, partial [Candidatus Daviesbacteria bacterium]|nr:FtsW/RodA/SpoVE family cell cycle protein [Candidatus Daviesbacteria bacterium]
MIKKTNLQAQKRQIDFSLLLITTILVIFGLIMVYDSSVIQGLKYFKDSYYYIRQQFIWVGLGVVSLFFFTHFDYKRFNKLSFPLLIVSILLSLAVFIPGLGVTGGGAHRWLGIGSFTLQPAEIIKLTGV